jgi:hypothetical protein
MIKNFIVDRVVRGNMYDHKTGELLWSLNQIQSPSLSMESESVDAVDALGTPIMSFDRSKTCTLSAENAIFDLSLLGEQVGSEAVEGTRIIPVFESHDVVDGGIIKLNNAPAADYPVTFIYVLENDGSLGNQLVEKAYAEANGYPESTLTFEIEGSEITLPADIKAGSRIFVSYEYEGKATYVVNSASNFPKAGKFVMEVLGRDVCDATTEVYAMLVLPNAKLSASTEVSFETEMTQGFELTAQQDYCSKNNELFVLIIPEED